MSTTAVDVSLDEIRHTCNEKDIVVCGNGAAVTTKGLGALIDGHDIVVRINDGHPRWWLRTHMGRKTTYWVNNWLAKSGRQQARAYRKFRDKPIVLRLRPEPLDPEIDASCYFWDNRLLESLADKLGSYPSSGCKAVFLFAEIVTCFAKMTIVGFDFWAEPPGIVKTGRPPSIWPSGLEMSPEREKALISRIVQQDPRIHFVA